MTKHKARRRIIIWIVCILTFYAIALWSLFWAIMLFGSALMVTSVLKLRQSAARDRERARLLTNCHYEHAAWLRGGRDDAMAFFGHHQPAGLDGKILWCSPPDAFPEISRTKTKIEGWVDPVFADGSLVAHGTPWVDWGEDERI